VSEIVGKTLTAGAGGGGRCYENAFVGQGAAGRGGRAGGGTNLLRAFDKASGKVVAEIELPAQPSGTPMTYLAGGKQFVVIATSDSKLVGLSLGE
jgi:quinoprotein glucose dehydrogenase